MGRLIFEIGMERMVLSYSINLTSVDLTLGGLLVGDGGVLEILPL